MGYPKRVRFEAVREIGFAAIGAAYSAIGSSTTKPVRAVRFNNSTNQDVYISIDGVTDHIKLYKGTFFLADFTANKVRDEGFFIDEGTVFYVRRVGVAPTSGDVSVETIIGL